jgi:hypothetical protein
LIVFLSRCALCLKTTPDSWVLFQHIKRAHGTEASEYKRSFPDWHVAETARFFCRICHDEV